MPQVKKNFRNKKTRSWKNRLKLPTMSEDVCVVVCWNPWKVKNYRSIKLKKVIEESCVLVEYLSHWFVKHPKNSSCFYLRRAFLVLCRCPSSTFYSFRDNPSARSNSTVHSFCTKVKNVSLMSVKLIQLSWKIQKSVMRCQECLKKCSEIRLNCSELSEKSDLTNHELAVSISKPELKI